MPLKLYILFFSISLLFSCNQNTKFIIGNYAGNNSNAIIKYSFKSDKTVTVEIINNFEDVITDCKYQIKDDKIFINSLPEQPYKVYCTVIDTLLINSDSCIIDNSGFKFYKDYKAQVNDPILINSSLKTEVTTPKTFFDSVYSQLELSHDQIQKHTLIDSIFYTGAVSNAVFKGDTIFTSHNGLKIGVIKYNDKISNFFMFLVVFNKTLDNTNYKIIYSAGEHYESDDYITHDYKFLSDTTFKIIETLTLANKKKRVVSIHKFKINEAGIIGNRNKKGYFLF
jgi:hypothetical protein